MKQLTAFFSNIEIDDIINIRRQREDSDLIQLVRARVVRLGQYGYYVTFPEQPNLPEEFVDIACIEERIKLPWRPRDLKDHLIIFLRRDGVSDEYVEDLRVRRNLIKRLMCLLTTQKQWRPNHGIEPLHYYMTGFDWLSSAQIDTILPEDAVPQDLNFQDMKERDNIESLSKEEFCNWLNEGKFEQEIAGMVMNLWLYTISTHSSASLPDFYHELLTTFIQEDIYVSTGATNEVLLCDLAQFIRKMCTLSFHVDCELPSDIEKVISDRIVAEVCEVKSYTSLWKSSGTVQDIKTSSVEDETHAHLEAQVLPWPQIAKDPLRERDDGRFAKAFVVHFVMGVGDFRQPRIRDDFDILNGYKIYFATSPDTL